MTKAIIISGGCEVRHQAFVHRGEVHLIEVTTAPTINFIERYKILPPKTDFDLKIDYKKNNKLSKTF